MYINHLTLSTGHTSRIESGAVAGETLARIAPWLEAATAAPEIVPLPVAALSAYTALGLVQDGALIVTIYGPGVAQTGGVAVPLVTMGVAKRSRHGDALWPTMRQMPDTLRAIKRPAEPWCAVAIYPTVALHPEALAWLGDLERCIAWAWVTRPVDGQ